MRIEVQRVGKAQIPNQNIDLSKVLYAGPENENRVRMDWKKQPIMEGGSWIFTQLLFPVYDSHTV